LFLAVSCWRKARAKAKEKSNKISEGLLLRIFLWQATPFPHGSGGNPEALGSRTAGAHTKAVGVLLANEERSDSKVVPGNTRLRTERSDSNNRIKNERLTTLNSAVWRAE